MTPAGYNIYASTGSGGTGSGYLRLNMDPIPAKTPAEIDIQAIPISTVSYDFQNPDSPNFNSPNLQVIANTVDPVTQQLVSVKSENFTPLISAPDYRFEFTVSQLLSVGRFKFNHDRFASVGSGILNSDTFSAVDAANPLYYVVTAVYQNAATGVLQESRYSAELTGAPLALNTLIRGIRIRDQSQVAQDYIGEIQAAQPTLSLIPGSTIREIHIEPFSNEIQKAYFLSDFVHRAKSFPALLAIDDPGMTGTSIPVSQSTYKQNLKTALTVFDDVTVQTMIDSAFDSLAQNFNVQRGGAKPAQVNQTFYTTTKPTQDLVVIQGAVVSSSTNSLAPSFVSKGQVTLQAANAQAFYNPNTKRYEVTVQMVADTPGSAGNVPANALDTVNSGAKGFSTINEVAADFGQNQDSNLTLSENAMNSLSSLDTGTEGGYQRISQGSPGVFEVKIVLSGDPYMERDYDPVRKKHIGGKVDIYVKGTNERTVVETFAFQFNVANNVRFDVIDATNLIFRARDSRLTPSNPIQEMLYNPSQNLGLRNHSNLPTTNYDLTGVVILDYQTIQLSTIIPQPPTHLDDFVEGDYRFRSNNHFTASLQPVRRVVSVVGQVSGTLDSVLGYALYKLQDQLIEGESTIATDYVQINQVGTVPSGQAILVNGEPHVLIGEIPEPLDSVGINTFTLAVYSADRTILYNGPTSANPDYLILPGSQTTPISIIRSSGTSIPNGSTVSVDYDHDENFKVTYVINDVLQSLQARINVSKHATADVLVKQSVENPMSTEATVQLLPNTDQVTVDSNIRTAFTVLTDTKGVGQGIEQSNVSTKMQDTTGVDFVVQPFTKMTLQDGAVRLRESVPSNGVFLASLSMAANAVYILTQALEFNTLDGGGGPTVFHGVFMDSLVMTPATSLTHVGSGLNLAWIIGKNGAVIPGYSDDATLAPIYITPEAIQAERLKLTANHVVVSLNAGIVPQDVPANHTFSATYIVNGDKGTKDITVSSVEYLTPGDLTLTFRAATK